MRGSGRETLPFRLLTQVVGKVLFRKSKEYYKRIRARCLQGGQQITRRYETTWNHSSLDRADGMCALRLLRSGILTGCNVVEEVLQHGACTEVPIIAFSANLTAIHSNKWRNRVAPFAASITSSGRRVHCDDSNTSQTPVQQQISTINECKIN